MVFFWQWFFFWHNIIPQNLFSSAAGTTCADKVKAGQLYGKGNTDTMCKVYSGELLNGVDNAKLSVDGIFVR